jgi:UrcA family protein
MSNFRRVLLFAALGCCALGLQSLRAQAGPAEPTEITISAPKTKVVGRDETLAPIEEATATARVSYEPAALTTRTGVKQLKGRVLKAARELCGELDRFGDDDADSCVFDAVKQAHPQVDAAIARAKLADTRR